MDVSSIRARNVAMLVSQHGGPTEFGRLIERDQAQVSQWTSQAKPKPIGGRLARHIEAKLGQERGWLDSPQWDGAAMPISQSDATITHSSLARFQRVRVRGVAMVDAEGFWQELEESKGDVYVEASTSDPDAYAVRIVGRRFYPVVDSGQCILMAPGVPLKMNKRVLVRLADGRHTVKVYMNHQDGLWMFASLTDANEVLELRDEEVAAVERVMAVSDSE